MRKRLLLLLLGFVAFYYLVHIAYDLPNLVHGKAVFKWIPGTVRSLLQRAIDLGCAFLFTVVPYMILYRLYPVRKIGAILLFTGIGVVMVFLLNYVMAHAYATDTLRLRHYFLNNLFFFCVYLFYGIIFYFTTYAYDKELEQRDLVIQNRQSELSFLRSQVNPHFIFNSLNNIYALVYEGSPQALPTIAGLSELMRYMLYDGDDKVSLEKELSYIRQYIELQAIRFEHPIQTELHVSGVTEPVLIPALLLIPFVENAFKHGDFTAGSEGLAITVYGTTAKTQFYCRNKKGTGLRDAGGGIGLTNVKRRLALLYPGKHRLEIEDHPDSFTIHLELAHE
jgi:sensor histidine kinase YesM